LKFYYRQSVQNRYTPVIHRAFNAQQSLLGPKLSRLISIVMANRFHRILNFSSMFVASDFNIRLSAFFFSIALMFAISLIVRRRSFFCHV